MRNPKVVVIGSGKLAHQLFPALHQTGNIDFVQVLSRKQHKGSKLAAILQCEVISSLDEIQESADIIFLAVPDSEIKELSSKLSNHKGAIVHSSGATDIEEIQHSNPAVFYPLQTFSMDKSVDFTAVPICIESPSSDLLKILENLAKSISKKVYFLNSEQRKYIHIAAVFACNFSNLMYQVSEDILDSKDIDPTILHNLIKETALKIQEMPAREAQTGPAVRKDSNTLQLHENILTQYPESYQKIYQLLSQQIQLNDER